MTNVVEPVCDCPKCGKLGLHYMAETETQSYPRLAVRIKEVQVQWYDNRDGDKPTTELQYENYYKYLKAEWVVRECFYCSHRFLQHWREYVE